MGSQGGLPWGSQGALWADWPWAMGRWALGHGPMGPLGRLALWTRAHGPRAMGPGTRNEYNVASSSSSSSSFYIKGTFFHFLYNISRNIDFWGPGAPKCIFGARGIPGGSPQGIPGGPLGRWALGHGPMGPLGRLALWTRAHGPMGLGPMGPSAYNARVPTSI